MSASEATLDTIRVVNRTVHILKQWNEQYHIPRLPGLIASMDNALSKYQRVEDLRPLSPSKDPTTMPPKEHHPLQNDLPSTARQAECDSENGRSSYANQSSVIQPNVREYENTDFGVGAVPVQTSDGECDGHDQEIEVISTDLSDSDNTPTLPEDKFGAPAPTGARRLRSSNRSIPTKRSSLDEVPQPAKPAKQTKRALPKSSAHVTRVFYNRIEPPPEPNRLSEGLNFDMPEPNRNVHQVSWEEWEEFEKFSKSLDLSAGAVLLNLPFQKDFDWSKLFDSDAPADLAKQQVEYREIGEDSLEWARITDTLKHTPFGPGLRKQLHQATSKSNALSLSDFEKGLRDGSWKADYIRDVDVSDVNEFPSHLGRIPGDVLNRDIDGQVSGVNKPYLYNGMAGSAFALHIEDEELWSINYLFWGEKLWIIIPPSEREELEKLCSWISEAEPALRRRPLCSQFVRHMSIFLPTSILVKWGIKFHIFRQGPGQAVLTSPGTYHQGYNVTENQAEAVNLAFSGWLPHNYVFCSFACTGPSNVTPMNVSRFHKYHKTLKINLLESLSLRERFEAQHELANVILSSKRTEKRDKSKAKEYVGGFDALELILFVTSIADDKSLAWLASALRSPDSEQPVRISEIAHPYDHFLGAKKGSALAELRLRPASLAFKRMISNRHRTSERSTPHGKGAYRAAITRLIDKETQSLVSELTEEGRRLVRGFQETDDEDIADPMKRHLKEMYHLGELLEPLADHFGNAVILCISDTDLERIRGMPEKLTRLIPGLLDKLRPKLGHSMGNLQTLLNDVDNNDGYWSNMADIQSLLHQRCLLPDSSDCAPRSPTISTSNVIA